MSATLAYRRANFGVWPASQADHIVQHEDLPVAVRARADANRGNAQLVGDLRRQFARHRFEHDGKCARRFHGARIANQAARPSPRSCPAPGNRQARCSDCGVSPTWPITGISASTSRAINSTRRSPPSTFTASAPASLTNRTRMAQRFRRFDVIAAIRHVGDQQSAPHPAPHSARVVQHLFHRSPEACSRARARPCPTNRRRAQRPRQLRPAVARLGNRKPSGKQSCPWRQLEEDKRRLSSQNVGHGNFAVARIECGTHVRPPGAVPLLRDTAPNLA